MGRYSFYLLPATAGIMMFFAASLAEAACAYCNPRVTLNSALAACFNDSFDDSVSQLEDEGRGFMLLDLTSCVDESTRGLPTASSTAERGKQVVVDTAFVVDRVGLECIRTKIAENDGNLDPSMQFDLTSCE